MIKKIIITLFNEKLLVLHYIRNNYKTIFKAIILNWYYVWYNKNNYITLLKYFILNFSKYYLYY
jgi:hypothetical protein